CGGTASRAQVCRRVPRCAGDRYGPFFFQAEDGIRGGHVTGVQTCALPISTTAITTSASLAALIASACGSGMTCRQIRRTGVPMQIGRASCRERVEVGDVEACLREEMRGHDAVDEVRDHLLRVDVLTFDAGK